MPETRSAREVVQIVFDALQAQLRGEGELEPFIDLVSEDVVLVEAERHPYPGGRWEGRDKVMEAVAGVQAAIGYSQIDVHKLLDDGETVCALTEAVYTNARGETLKMPLAEIFVVRNGKIVHIEPYYHDIARLRMHMGLDVAA